MRKAAPIIMWSAGVLILVVGGYVWLFRNQILFYERFPDTWVNNERAIQSFFGPAQRIQDRIDFRDRVELWDSLCGDWKAIFPEESNAEFEITKVDATTFNFSATREFPYVNSSGNELNLRIEGAAVYADSFSLTLIPIEGSLLVQVHELPIDTEREPIEFVFERPTENEAANKTRIPSPITPRVD